MEKMKQIRPYLIRIFLIAGLLLTAGWGLRIANDTREKVEIPSGEPVINPEPAGTSSEAPTETIEAMPDTFDSVRTPFPGPWSGPLSNSQTFESASADSHCRWKLTFEDNFAGEALDASLWDTGYKAGDQEAQYYVPDAFELGDGILRIRAEERQVGDRQYASGILSTQGKFDQQYGRFVIRARAPSGQGLWPAFWMMPSSGDWPPEIDVFEVLGHDTQRVYMSHRWLDAHGELAFETRGFHGPDFSQNFHIFGVEWDQEQIIWRVDGIERSRQTIGVPHEPMFLLVNLAVGGEWPGYPDESTPFPSYLDVDYVRAYAWTCLEGNSNEVDAEDLQTE